jgi:hypothetical protein
MTDAQRTTDEVVGPSGFRLDELIADGENRLYWARTWNPDDVRDILGALRELRTRREQSQ